MGGKIWRYFLFPATRPLGPNTHATSAICAASHRKSLSAKSARSAFASKPSQERNTRSRVMPGPTGNKGVPRPLVQGVRELNEYRNRDRWWRIYWLFRPRSELVRTRWQDYVICITLTRRYRIWRCRTYRKPCKLSRIPNSHLHPTCSRMTL